MSENTISPQNPMFLKSTGKLRDEFLNELRMYKITQSNGRELLYILEELVRRGREWERLYLENDDLRLQLQAAREQLEAQKAVQPRVVGVDPAEPDAEKDAIVIIRRGVIEDTILTDKEFRRLYQNEYPAPSGELRHFFNIASGPYRAPDTQQERDFSWSRGPFGSWSEADQEWKAYIKRQREDGKP